MRKTKAESLKTREHLLLAALNTFYERGVSRASLNEIAQAAGVTRGALYWHFKNKEDLFEALFQRICNEVTEATVQDIETQSPSIWENLEQSLNNVFIRLEHNDIHYKFFNIMHLKCEHTEQNHAIIDIMHQYHQRWDGQLLTVIQICLQQNKLPEKLNPSLAAVYLQSSIGGLIDLWLHSPQRFDLSAYAPRIIAASLSTLQNSTALQDLQAPPI